METRAKLVYTSQMKKDIKACQKSGYDMQKIYNITELLRIEVFEIASKEDRIYQELVDQYKTNPEVRALLHKTIFRPAMIWAGDFRLITMLNRAIDKNYYM